MSGISQVCLSARWKELTAVINWVSFFLVEVVAPITVVNVTAEVLTKKMVFDETYRKIGVAGSHLSSQGYAISYFVVVATEWKAIECKYLFGWTA